MELKAGMVVKHKLSGHEMMILEVGPRLRKVFVPGMGWTSEEYLAKGMVGARLSDMSYLDIYDYEIVGVEGEDTRTLLMEKGCWWPRRGGHSPQAEL